MEIFEALIKKRKGCPYKAGIIRLKSYNSSSLLTLFTLSYYIVEQSRLWSHLLIHWQTHTLGSCPKANPISIGWLGHPNPNPTFLHYRSIPCLNTLVGSVRYLIALMMYSMFYNNAWLDSTLLHCLAIPNPNTSLRYTLCYYIAKQFLNTNTLLSYTQS